MAPNKTASHIPYPVFLTDTAPEPFEESGVNSPPASPTAFIRTSNMLGLVGIPAPVDLEDVIAQAIPCGNDVTDAPSRPIKPVVKQRSANFNFRSDFAPDDTDEEDQVLEMIGLTPAAQGPSAIVQHGTFVVPLPEVSLEFPLPPPHHPLLNTHYPVYGANGFEFAPIPVPQLMEEVEHQGQDAMVGAPAVHPDLNVTGLPSPASTAASDEGLEQVPELAGEEERGDGAEDPVPGSELEDDLFDFEDEPTNLLHATSAAPSSKPPSAPVLVQPRGDGQAEVRLIIEDDEGFLDDIEEYINGEFEMYSFGALSEMMGERVDTTSEWVERTGAAVAALKPREARRVTDMRPVRPLDAFAGLAEGEEAYRPPTPLGMTESDEEDLNRPLSPTGDGDSEVTAVEGGALSSFSSASGNDDAVEEAHERLAVFALLESKGKGKAAAIRVASASNLREILADRTTTLPLSPPACLPALGEAGPSTVSRGTPEAAPATPTPPPRAATLKRKASDADLDETKDTKGKGKAAEAVKRQRLLLRRSSHSSLGSM